MSSNPAVLQALKDLKESQELKNKFLAFIKEHRPGTLEAEYAALLNIANDCYFQGFEDSIELARAIIDNADRIPPAG